MAKKRPNVLIVFTDQQRADTIGALGNQIIRTPNLDRLCAEGVAFDSAYSPSPVCVPARCSMMYGQYVGKTKCYDNSSPMPLDGRPSFVEMLTKTGMRTHGIGKMHFSPDLHALRGFQTRERQEEFVDKVENDEYQKYLHESDFGDICAPHGVRGEMYYVPQPSQLPPRFHPAQWVGDRATKFIAENGKKPEPWLLFASFIHPHPPFSPPSPWHDLYPATMMPAPKMPPHHESFWTWINRHQNRYKYRDQGWDLNFLRCMKAYYYACISFVDYQVGRILSVLEETGCMDDTLIVFTSDHGEFLGDYGCFGKRNMLDPAARIPLLIRYPDRFARGSVCRKPVNLVDLAPTLTSACGLQPRPDWDGADLADIAAGNIERQAVFSQFQRPEKAIYMAVTERWKYFYSAADDAAWLFDRVRDPEETHNLSGLGWVADTEKTMRQCLHDHLRQLGETDGLDGEKWKKMPPFKLPQNPDAGLGRRQQAWANHDLPGYVF